MSVIQLDGREYPPEAVWQAQELYCVARLPYHRVAAELGIAESTLKRWGKQYGWSDKRAALAQAQAEMRADIVLARAGMIKELLADRNPIVGFAVAKLEELALKQAEAERQGKLAQAEAAPPRVIETPADAYGALKEAVEAKLGKLLADPGEVDLKAIKDVKEALRLLEDLRPKEGKKKTKGLSAADVELIRKKILGG